MRENWSPGASALTTKTFQSPMYLLNIILNPQTTGLGSNAGVYKWKIKDVDKIWRDSYNGKKLARDWYTIEYSLSGSVLGEYTLYLDTNSSITINVSA